MSNNTGAEDGGIADQDEIQTFKKFALRELEQGPRGAQDIAHQFNMEHRKEAVVRGDGETVTADAAAELLDQMVSDGFLVQIEDPDGWYQLADWGERPLRVLAVSHHIIEISGADQIATVWLDESIRAARAEHGIEEDRLKGLPADDDRSLYQLMTHRKGTATMLPITQRPDRPWR